MMLMNSGAESLLLRVFGGIISYPVIKVKGELDLHIPRTLDHFLAPGIAHAFIFELI